MKTLLIMRHAKSSWSDASLSDHERPLNKRGKRDAPRIGALLVGEELTPDLIITSSARRALETAESVATACDYDAQIVVTRDLYHADTEAYLSAARKHGVDHDKLMVIGHNPGIEDLVDQMAGGWYRMPTAALAEIRLDVDDWAEVADDAVGNLVNLWLPREL